MAHCRLFLTLNVQAGQMPSSTSKRPRETPVSTQKMVRDVLLEQSGVEIPTVTEKDPSARRATETSYRDVWFAPSAAGQQARKCGSKNKNCAAKNALECKGLLKDSPRLEVRYALTVGRNGMTLRHPNWSYEAVCCCKACLEQHPRPLIMTPSYPMPSTCMSLSSIDF